MTMVFVDTVALIALGDEDDGLHNQAMQMRKQLIEEKHIFVTTSAVILELCNAFSYPHKNLRKTAVDMVESIKRSNRWILIDVDRIIMEKGFQKFKNMTDKKWSLVDCISMVVAEEFNITNIFTKDNDFIQAGFTTLLK